MKGFCWRVQSLIITVLLLKLFGSMFLILKLRFLIWPCCLPSIPSLGRRPWAFHYHVAVVVHDKRSIHLFRPWSVILTALSISLCIPWDKLSHHIQWVLIQKRRGWILPTMPETTDWIGRRIIDAYDGWGLLYHIHCVWGQKLGYLALRCWFFHGHELGFKFRILHSS